MNTDNKLQKIIKLLKDKIFFIWISFITNEEKKFNFIYKNKYVLFYSDNEQISRVFLNLIKNSIESIQEKYQKEQDIAKKITIELIDESDYIEIIITDDGIGFSEDIVNKLLKPYFTTKAKGSGLGLSIVNKIVTDHDGILELGNNDLKGAYVKIIFNNLK